MNKRFLFLIFTIFCFITRVYVEDSYYDLLGIKKDAEKNEIRSQFKKLSLKFHPDKNQGKEEKAKEKFAKIVNAYETLRDDKKRKIYDERGEKGLQEEAANEAAANDPHLKQFRENFAGINLEEMFGSFFGGGGGFNFGGGGGERSGRGEKFEGRRKDGIFSLSEVIELDLGNISSFYRRLETWILFFYDKEEMGNKYKDTLIELAIKYNGIFKVAAINCETDKEICDDEFFVEEFPDILGFSSDTNKKEPKEYDGKITIYDLSNFAINLIDSFIQIIDDTNIVEFFNQDLELHKALFFSNSTPPLYRSLSRELKGKLLFGEVSKNSSLVEYYNVTKFPTFMIINEVENNNVTIYEGEFNKDKKEDVLKFLKNYTYSKKGDEKRLKANVGKYLEFNLNNVRTGTCGPTESILCFFYIIDDKLKDERLKNLDKLAKYFKNEPIHFFHININKINIEMLFDEDEEDIDVSAYVIRPKIKKFSKFKGKDISEFDELRQFVEDCIGGTIKYRKLTDNLFNAMSYFYPKKEENKKQDL